jgi:adenylyltransferase/sulfurtransferase
LGELENNINKINNSKTNVVFCQSGMRSKKGVEILNKHGIEKAFSFKGGILPIIEALKMSIK